ncbi:MAG: AAA family ATPase [Gammaproteobacteria bacterium]
MSFLNKIKPNKPTTNIEGYFIAMLAKSKFGKTTFALDLSEEFYDGLDKTLLVATEVGYKTVDGVFAVNVTGFDYAEDDTDETQKGFIELVDELIEEKGNHPFKFIIIDTITALERYATKYVISEKNISDNPKKRYADISDIPWGGGYNALAEAIYEQIDRLKKNGFGVFVIGHEKTKKITNRDGFEYDYTSFNTQTKTSDIIEREADMIIYGDMMTKKDGTKGVKTERSLKFRSDGNFLCGTRFRAFPDEIENSAKVFKEEFEKAVLASFKGDKKRMKEAVKEDALKEEKRETIRQEKKVEVEAEKETRTADELIELIDEEISKIESVADKKKLLPMIEEAVGMKNYKKSDDVEGLSKILDEVLKQQAEKEEE